jgi:L-lactate dehydrogenase complex protein LldG
VSEPKARTEILRRIRAAGAGRPAPAPVPRDYAHARDHDDPVGLFAERVADYRATVRHTEAAGLAELIGHCLRERGVRVVVAPVDLPAGWQVAGPDWWFDEPPLRVADLDRADAVLTGCAVAIAETGTIVLDGGPGQGRRALTLVPDYHLCVVAAASIVVTVPQALAALDPVRPLTFVSGPSATSDIELSRVEGVHGPRTLEVIVVR